jgi:hypothetical protein
MFRMCFTFVANDTSSCVIFVCPIGTQFSEKWFNPSQKAESFPMSASNPLSPVTAGSTRPHLICQTRTTIVEILVLFNCNTAGFPIESIP